MPNQRFCRKKIKSIEKGKFPLRHISHITDVFHIQSESFQIRPSTFNRNYWVLCIVSVEAGAQTILQNASRHDAEERIACWCIPSMLLQANAVLSAISGSGRAPGLEKTALTGLESALSGRCRQAAKLMGPFLVMPVEEVTFVRMEWVARWERRLLWESTFHEKEVVWQKSWQSVNKENVEEGESVGASGTARMCDTSVLFLSMVSVINTKGTCLGMAFWNPVLKSSLSVADHICFYKSSQRGSECSYTKWRLLSN